MRINSATPSFHGVSLHSNAAAAKKLAESAEGVLMNLAEKKLSLSPKFLVATGKDAVVLKDAQSNSDTFNDVILSLLAKVTSKS